MSVHRKPNRKGQVFIDKRKDPERKMQRKITKALIGGGKKKSKKSSFHPIMLNKSRNGKKKSGKEEYRVRCKRSHKKPRK